MATLATQQCVRCRETNWIDQYDINKKTGERYTECRRCHANHVAYLDKLRASSAAEGKKRCYVCKETKYFSHFYIAVNGPDGHSARCKECNTLSPRPEGAPEIKVASPPPPPSVPALPRLEVITAPKPTVRVKLCCQCKVIRAADMYYEDVVICKMCLTDIINKHIS